MFCVQNILVMCLYICIGTWAHECGYHRFISSILHSNFPPYSQRQGLTLKPKRSTLSKLLVQKVMEILLILHPQCQNYSHALPYPTCFMGTGDPNSDAQICIPNTLPTVPSPQTPNKYSSINVFYKDELSWNVSCSFLNISIKFSKCNLLLIIGKLSLKCPKNYSSQRFTEIIFLTTTTATLVHYSFSTMYTYYV